MRAFCSLNAIRVLTRHWCVCTLIVNVDIGKEMDDLAATAV